MEPMDVDGSLNARARFAEEVLSFEEIEDQIALNNFVDRHVWNRAEEEVLKDRISSRINRIPSPRPIFFTADEEERKEEKMDSLRLVLFPSLLFACKSVFLFHSSYPQRTHATQSSIESAFFHEPCPSDSESSDDEPPPPISISSKEEPALSLQTSLPSLTSASTTTAPTTNAQLRESSSTCQKLSENEESMELIREKRYFIRVVPPLSEKDKEKETEEYFQHPFHFNGSTILNHLSIDEAMKVGIEKDPLNWEAHVPISLPLPKLEKMEVVEEKETTVVKLEKVKKEKSAKEEMEVDEVASIPSMETDAETVVRRYEDLFLQWTEIREHLIENYGVEDGLAKEESNDPPIISFLKTCGIHCLNEYMEAKKWCATHLKEEMKLKKERTERGIKRNRKEMEDSKKEDGKKEKEAEKKEVAITHRNKKIKLTPSTPQLLAIQKSDDTTVSNIAIIDVRSPSHGKETFFEDEKEKKLLFGEGVDFENMEMPDDFFYRQETPGGGEYDYGLFAEERDFDELMATTTSVMVPKKKALPWMSSLAYEFYKEKHGDNFGKTGGPGFSFPIPPTVASTPEPHEYGTLSLFFVFSHPSTNRMQITAPSESTTVTEPEPPYTLPDEVSVETASPHPTHPPSPARKKKKPQPHVTAPLAAAAALPSVASVIEETPSVYSVHHLGRKKKMKFNLDTLADQFSERELLLIHSKVQKVKELFKIEDSSGTSWRFIQACLAGDSLANSRRRTQQEIREVAELLEKTKIVLGSVPVRPEQELNRRRVQ